VSHDSLFSSSAKLNTSFSGISELLLPDDFKSHTPSSSQLV